MWEAIIWFLFRRNYVTIPEDLVAALRTYLDVIYEPLQDTI